MTKFVNRILIAVVSFFPLLALLHSIEKDSPPARTSGTVLPLPQQDEPERQTDLNATEEGSRAAWIGYPRFAASLSCICPTET